MEKVFTESYSEGENNQNTDKLRSANKKVDIATGKMQKNLEQALKNQSSQTVLL